MTYVVMEKPDVLTLRVNGPIRVPLWLVGDLVIIAVDGQPVQYRDTLLGIVRAKKQDDMVTFTVLPPDGAKPRKINLTRTEL